VLLKNNPALPEGPKENLCKPIFHAKYCIFTRKISCTCLGAKKYIGAGKTTPSPHPM